MTGVSLLKNPNADEAANQDCFTDVTSTIHHYLAMEKLLLPPKYIRRSANYGTVSIEVQVTRDIYDIPSTPTPAPPAVEARLRPRGQRVYRRADDGWTQLR
jgi:hypothetical protein